MLFSNVLFDLGIGKGFDNGFGVGDNYMDYKLSGSDKNRGGGSPNRGNNKKFFWIIMIIIVLLLIIK
jgi:hypothetical protein